MIKLTSFNPMSVTEILEFWVDPKEITQITREKNAVAEFTNIRFRNMVSQDVSEMPEEVIKLMTDAE